MTETIASMPSRPLRKSEVLANADDMREYCVNPTTEEAYVVVLLGEDRVHALGFDEAADGWVSFYTEQISNTTEEAMDALEAAIYEWAETEFGNRLEEGELRMVGPDDPPTEVQQGLEPEYNCPECDYYETGLSTGPRGLC